MNIDDDLVTRARELSGIQEKTALVEAGLKALIAREASKRLAAMGGTQKNMSVPPRRRPDFSPLQSRAKKAG